MRQIKFRGWDNKGKIMSCMVSIYCESDGSSWWVADVLGENGRKIYNFGGIEGNPNYVVMQYTGIDDKNGKEIFEGDIVKFKEYRTTKIETGYVSFRDGSFVIISELFSHYRWIDYVVEVIGNIYENPELVSKSL